LFIFNVQDNTDEDMLMESYHLEEQTTNPVFNKDNFVQYLKGLCGGRRSDTTAQSAANSVQYFFTYKPYPQRSLCDIILNKTNIRDYVDHLEKVKVYAGSTIKERVVWLNDAINYLTEESDSSVKLHMRKEEIQKSIKTTTRALAKLIEDQRNQQARLSHAKVLCITINTCLRYVVLKVNSEESATMLLDSKLLQQKVNEAIIKAKERTNFTPKDHKLVLGYLAAQLIYTNAQRSGVVQYMTINEYMKRQQLHDNTIIQVHKHKTSRRKGPAQIVINNSMVINHLNDYFLHIRTPLRAANEELEERMFLMATGTEFRKVYETINNIAEQFDLSVPTPTTHRKMVASDATEELAPQDVEILQDHMSHSRSTAERYYQKKTVNAALRSHHNIDKLVQNRGFTHEQSSNITREWPLTSSKTPSLRFCELIGLKYKFDKTPQQIQDRWKYLHKRNT